MTIRQLPSQLPLCYASKWCIIGFYCHHTVSEHWAKIFPALLQTGKFKLHNSLTVVIVQQQHCLH